MTVDEQETPQEAYNRGRAEVMRLHQYRTEEATGLADCACGLVESHALIAAHIEEAAEDAGNRERDAVVQAIAATLAGS